MLFPVDSDLIVQELGELNLQINVIPKGLEQYLRFAINNKLRFIDNFQILSFSLNSLVKNSHADDFKY